MTKEKVNETRNELNLREIMRANQAARWESRNATAEDPAAVVVIVGIRKDGCVGYFTETPLPEGWKFAGYEEISGIMESLRRDKTETLKVMNDHWA